VLGSLGAARASAGAEVDLSGSGRFKPASIQSIQDSASVLPFSPADLASGTWSFLMHYDDQAADVDPDPYVGRYAGAIRVFRVTIGNTTVELPTQRAELLVSDGGEGFRNRESIRFAATTATAAGRTLTAGWIELNQKTATEDLRGAHGLLTSDRLPDAQTIASFGSSNPFDRFFLLRIDAGEGRPLLYLTSSQVSVASKPAGTQ